MFVFNVRGAQGKSGSFGFAEGLACVTVKAKCANCAVVIFIFFSFSLCSKNSFINLSSIYVFIQ